MPLAKISERHIEANVDASIHDGLWWDPRLARCGSMTHQASTDKKNYLILPNPPKLFAKILFMSFTCICIGPIIALIISSNADGSSSLR